MLDAICLQPCLGINDNLTTIGRQACYAAHLRLGPDKSHLGCAPALYAEVEEDVDFVRNDWVIAVESCEKECANHLVEEKKGQVHATVRVDQFLQQAGFDVPSLPREHAPLTHPAVVAVADEIVRVAGELAGREAP
ncbi:MAG: hypothetical protein COZ06_07970 [Armatimonadetes bacterium CG_4_10_14_3_um_filter_66_18]|nr:hypothetical protein [Armatimonadota bacterium]OIO95953.1 MAG: hypothetical protein AUJ96_25680 [Armatimonadetes bacterium CG2_30_66_41]PIU92336.1 MAG: hypothetical protein COS65_18455 [Armatimonadetes bacterium CG06_land_8_20_14_3_00_66_21]PIX46517.1 MAG: hypothetical protein COZ57_11630 [Armatimonadetes bacterium CG_4_8_14_3_um_filter_66_20]PIY50702.1 MAG: hypothetical protein COZ06_07970 [Armatimonadetes bacterium CG_4_10_14_3_um_filter_66_18]PIZ43988.1 MAG: hypothetical protein COY42_14